MKSKPKCPYCKLTPSNDEFKSQMSYCECQKSCCHLEVYFFNVQDVLIIITLPFFPDEEDVSFLVKFNSNVMLKLDYLPDFFLLPANELISKLDELLIFS